MEKDVIVIHHKLNKKLAELEVARSSFRSLDNSLNETREQAQAAGEAQELAQHVAQVIQQKAHDQIARVVSRCLSAVFDEPYEFRIHFERKRGRTEARLTFDRDGMEVDPMTASGGGVVDIASFALRLSCLILNKPPLRRAMVMDEPFRFVSEEFRDRVKALLETLSEEMKTQFVMVTHINELKMGKVIEIG